MSRYLIAAGRFNDLITKALLAGAEETLQEAGIAKSQYDVVWTPGAFELPTVAGVAARSGKYSAVICLGCVIRGETPHFDYVAGEAAAGLMRTGQETGVPVIFGVVTTDTAEQALARSGLKGGNKGKEAAASAIDMVRTMGRLKELTSK